MGYTEIDCVVVDLDNVREKALNIALNKIQGEFDRPKLADLLAELEKDGFSYDITGFEEKDAMKLWQEQQRREGAVAEDNFDAAAEAEAIETPVSREGDVWLIGRHRLMCGDSTDQSAVAKLMDGAKAKLVFTDPPWNVDYGGAAHSNWKQRSILNDNMSTEEFHAFLLSAFQAMASVSEPGCMTYCVMSAAEWGNLMLAMKAAGYHWSSTIIWYKDSFVLSRKDYMTQYEPIWFGWLEGERALCHLEDRRQSDVWEIARPKKSPDHPTTKPIALAGRAITNSSRAGDVVLDLFGGSGTTLLAAEQTDRTAYLMEKDPRYADTIVKRAALFRETDEGIFLLRGGKKYLYHETGDLPNATQ
jgi:DNA modification methylase